MVVIVFGLPGSGKSYFASRLAEKLKADYVNTDKVRKALFLEPSYSPGEKRRVYKELFDAMYEHANSKKPLVIDGTFYEQGTRDNFKTLALDLNINLKWIEIFAKERIIKNRLSEKREYSDADFKVYKSVKEQYTAFKGKHLLLESTDDNLGQMLQKAIDYLSAL